MRRRRTARVMEMFVSWKLPLLAFGAYALATGSADAVFLTLTPKERDAAIEMGRQSIISDRFGAEWTVSGEGSGEGLVVMTPFHRLALAARNSAFKSEELKPKDIDSLMREQEGRLTLWATLRGNKANFDGFYTPLLANGHRRSRPASPQ